jgi:outer membrane protein TolC
MKRIRIYCIIVTLCLSHSLRAQVATDSLLMLPDTVRPLTIDNFYHHVLQNHPVARQAMLLNEFAREEIRLARGNFDPRLEATYMAKNFGNVDYYRIFNGSVTFPSVFPLDPRIGVEQNNGKYLNPERYISGQYDFRQFYAGVSLPLLRGLVTDERRAALKQGELFGDMMEAEQIRIINKLLLDAAKDYWHWSISYYKFRLYNQSVFIAEEIYRRVKLNNELGEAAPIDTVQAKITLQQRLVERQEALLDFQNAGLKISNYLWDGLNQPLENLPPF